MKMQFIHTLLVVSVLVIAIDGQNYNTPNLDNCNAATKTTIVFDGTTNYNGNLVDSTTCVVYYFAMPSGGFTNTLAFNFTNINATWVTFVREEDFASQTVTYQMYLSGYAGFQQTHQQVIVPNCAINMHPTSGWYLLMTGTKALTYSFTAATVTPKAPVAVNETSFQYGAVGKVTFDPASGYEIVHLTPANQNVSVEVTVVVSVTTPGTQAIVSYSTTDECADPDSQRGTILAPFGTSITTRLTTTEPNSTLKYLIYPFAGRTGSVSYSVSSDLVQCGMINKNLTFCGNINYMTAEYENPDTRDSLVQTAYNYLKAASVPAPCLYNLKQFLCGARFPKCQEYTNFPLMPCESDCNAVLSTCDLSTFTVDFLDATLADYVNNCAARPLTQCYVTPYNGPITTTSTTQGSDASTRDTAMHLIFSLVVALAMIQLS